LNLVVTGLVFCFIRATKAEDEPREIEKMANTIRSYDDDDDDDVTAAVYRVS
jgi:hypothetical protein